LKKPDQPKDEDKCKEQRKYPEHGLTNVLFDEDVQPYSELHLDGVTVTLLPNLSHWSQIEDIGIYFDLGDTISFNVLTSSPQDALSLHMALDHYAGGQ